jgi:hypothetical protein|tara:strand:- start:59 stop:298 length:240 start_codon:yes stop_codon:yes gene_type:complete
MVNDPLKTLIEIDKEAGSTDLIKIHRRRCIADNKCANCNLDLSESHTEDEEYKISALCLDCQKEFFRQEEEPKEDVNEY